MKPCRALRSDIVVTVMPQLLFLSTCYVLGRETDGKQGRRMLDIIYLEKNK
jgi:hypothetical protein